MSRGGINRAFSWLKKVLEITEVTNAPDVLLPTVQPELDVFGWERLEEMETQVQSTAGVTFAVSLETVPEGEMWYVVAAELTHDEGASKDLTLVLVNRVGVEVALITTSGTPQFFRRSLGSNSGTSPIIVPQGWTLRGVSRNQINIGFTFQISAHFQRIAVGEYVPGSPYG